MLFLFSLCRITRLIFACRLVFFLFTLRNGLVSETLQSEGHDDSEMLDPMEITKAETGRTSAE